MARAGEVVSFGPFAPNSARGGTGGCVADGAERDERAEHAPQSHRVTLLVQSGPGMRISAQGSKEISLTTPLLQSESELLIENPILLLLPECFEIHVLEIEIERIHRVGPFVENRSKFFPRG